MVWGVLLCRIAAWGWLPALLWLVGVGAASGVEAAAACAAAAADMVARIPAVNVTLGGWFGTRWVIFTFFRPSSVKISVNWLI